ncbi:aspartic peptidase domain-containing protein [Chaetomium strumarium]|uniref:Aspartic peptidase domain-containing protein n=1 Tax=Chaetomium strumarium TaxID=1170767 RepID=A0AAJ0M6P1_9PEZI|nr:aspartic peptidase domain-containing protein [Chaetomium strumarium]
MKLQSAALLIVASGAASRNVVQFNVTRGLPGVHLGSLPSAGRRDTHPEQLINDVSGGGYYVQVEVGTPGQSMTMLLDTGSSDAWVLGHDADLCTEPDLQHVYGMTCTDTYDPDKSSTDKLVKSDGFKITYLDGGTAAGDYISDDFTIGGVTVKSLQMAYVTKAARGSGILGLGFSASERAATKYPNLIDEMANQGLIGCKAFSLYLNDRRADSGTILFGGIDTDKFIGPLSILPLYKPAGGNYSSFEVNYAGISLTFTNGSDLSVPTSVLDHPTYAVLDSGTTLSYLPDEMTAPLYSALHTVYDADLRMTLIDCAYLQAEPSLRLTFTFSPSPSTARISVPVWELILDILPAAYPAPPEFPSQRACVFGIQSTALFSSTGTVKGGEKGVNFTLLGDSFLRSAYAVFDLTHYQIGLAQANLNSSTSTVVELSGEEATGLPSVTGVVAQQTTFTPTSTATVQAGDEESSRSSGRGGRGGRGENLAGGGGRVMLSEALAVTVVTWVFAGLGVALTAFC